MKKILNIILVINILFCYLFPVGFSVKASDNEYKVSLLDKDGNISEIGSFLDYNEAKNKMNEQESNSSKVAVIYKNGKLINAKYATVKFNPGNIAYLFPTSTSDSFYTAIHTSYGVDAAFIDYDPNTNRVKLKISGFTGWTSIDYLNIIPVTQLYSNNLRINENIDDAITVRNEPSTGASSIGYVLPGQIFSFADKKNSGGYTWYKINYNGDYGWIANVDNGISTDVDTSLRTYYQNWGETGNLLHYFAYNTSGYESNTYTNLGPSPNFLTEYKTYYSFDGNYFYDDLIKMLDDYRSDSYSKAVNKDNPYYAYYLYLPNRSETSYTADDLNYIVSQRGFTIKPDESVKYVDDNGNFINGINRNGVSKMVGEGASFIASQELYGVNALLTFSAAINESATGTSELAFAKNNLFGHNAYDSCPFSCATSYRSVSEAIYEHARLTGENYNNPNHVYYHGSHYGNKGSGMNVMYATDPYWGEKAAQNYYFADSTYGKADYLYNTIGVKLKSSDIYVYALASTSSKVIYNVNNDYEEVANIPLIVIDKIQNDEGWWYKVYTEIGLDENKNIVIDTYNRKYSYGYIKSEDLYVSNNQPSINAKDITIQSGTKINLLDGVTASDIEDGNITSRITYDSNVNFDKPGIYQVTYSVKDKSNFNVSKTIKVTVVNNDGEFYFEHLKEIDGKLQLKGFLTIPNINNTLDKDIKYQLVLTDETGTSVNQTLNRITDKSKMPFMIESVGGYDYTYAWFEGNIDVDSLKSGNYSLSVIASYESYVSKSVVSNVFGFDMDSTYVGNTKSALIRNNYESRKAPIQLFVRDQLMGEKTASSEYNIYNEYSTIKFDNNKLLIKGASYIIGGNYSKETSVIRKLIFENTENYQQYSYDIGSITNGDYNIELRVPDGFDKTRAWFNANIDVSELPKGTYTINIVTSSNVADFGELQDIFALNIDTKFSQNGKNYSFKVDENNRYRVVMIIS